MQADGVDGGRHSEGAGELRGLGQVGFRLAAIRNSQTPGRGYWKLPASRGWQELLWLGKMEWSVGQHPKWVVLCPLQLLTGLGWAEHLLVFCSLGALALSL